MISYHWRLLLVGLITLGCSDSAMNESTHPVAYDLEPLAESSGKSDGLSERFEQEWLMSDLFFLNTSALTAADLQRFLEDTPYGVRSWLADLVINRKSASELIVKVAHERGVNPLLILTRMQVEQSLAYYHCLLFYKGLMREEELLSIDDYEPYSSETVGFGVADWYLAQGETERARELLEEVAVHPRWPGYGRIAAEVELARLQDR